jgi:HEAT repeat protein
VAPIALPETKPAASQTAPAITDVQTPATVPVAANTLTPEQRQAAIDAETDRLQQWSMNDDQVSLSNILADLTNPDKEVREAAIEAAEQFGSTNAIPVLQNLAANNEDSEEKAALLEAANFLSLPSINSLPRTPEQIQAAAKRKADREARRQAPMLGIVPNQDSQPSSDQSPQTGTHP